MSFSSVHFKLGSLCRWCVSSLTSSKAVNLCVGCVMCQSEGLCVCVCGSVVSDEFGDLRLKQTVNSISPVPFIVKIWPVKLSD